jgi:hypothetical protein
MPKQINANAEDAYVVPEFDEKEWDTVEEASPTLVLFDTVGDVFIGQYKGIETITPEKTEDEPFDRFIFTDRNGNRYAINVSFKLEKAMSKVTIDQWTRITYVGDIPTGRKLNPMKDFKVDVKR